MCQELAIKTRFEKTSITPLEAVVPLSPGQIAGEVTAELFEVMFILMIIGCGFSGDVAATWNS